MTPATLFQTDLFPDLDRPHKGSRRLRGLDAEGSRTRPRPQAIDPQTAAQVLEKSEDFKVLRRLQPRAVAPSYHLAPGESVAVLVDVETTGLDFRADEIIEIGMVAFVHNAAGQVGPVIGVLSLLREPSVPISPQITRLTGITKEMVAGAVFDLDAIRRLLEPADLVIAHNAKFDRNFCERLHDDFVHKAWACSLAEVRWAESGYEGAKLGYLVNQNGWFHNRHRAVDDCHALLEVLAAPMPDRTGPALGHLLASSQRSRVRIWAQYAPYDQKDVLKRRGYRWNNGTDGRPKSWWTEIDEEALALELRFLDKEVYLAEVDLPREGITAYERYRI